MNVKSCPEGESIELDRIQLPKSDIFYERPKLKEDSAPIPEISAEYLLERLTYALGRLSGRLDVATSKHHGKYKTDIENAIQMLETNILQAISNLNNHKIASLDELKIFCDKVEKAVVDFKSARSRDTEDMIKPVAQAAELFLQEERAAIRGIFSLKKPAESKIQKPDKSGDLSKRINSLSPEGRAFVVKVINNPDKYQKAEKVLKQADNLINSVFTMLAPLGIIKNELSEFKNEFKNSSSNIGSILPDLQNLNSDISNIFEGFSDGDKINRLPEPVIKAIKSVVEQYIALLNRLSKIVKNYKSALDQLKVLVKSLGQFKKTIQLGEGLIGDTNESGVFENYIDKFEQLKADFEESCELAISVSSEIALMWSEVSPVIKIINNNSTEKALNIKYGKCSNPLNEIIENGSSLSEAEGLNEFFVEMTDSKAPAPEEEKTEVLTENQEDEPVFKWAKVGNMPGKIFWNKIDPEKRRDIIITRIFSAWPVAQFLAEQGRWAELKWFLARTNDENFRKECKLGIKCFGADDAPYKDAFEMINDCFPKTADEAVSSELPIFKSADDSVGRINWNKISTEEKILEARRKMIQRMPILNELVQSIQTAKEGGIRIHYQIMLANILSHMHTSDITNKFVLGIVSRLFEDRKEFLKAAFPEAY